MRFLQPQEGERAQSEYTLDPDPGHMGQEDWNRPDTSLLLLGNSSAISHSTSTPRQPGNGKVPTGSLGLRSVL